MPVQPGGNIMNLNMHTRWLVVLLGAVSLAMAQGPEGRQSFQTRCAVCHGTDGNGGEHAPSVLGRIARSNDQELAALLKEGIPQRGMPGFNDLPAAEMGALTAFLRSMAPAGGGRAGRGMPVRASVTLSSGQTLQGTALGRTSREMQLRTDDQRIHLLRKTGEQYREVTSQSDWPSF